MRLFSLLSLLLTLLSIACDGSPEAVPTPAATEPSPVETVAPPSAGPSAAATVTPSSVATASPTSVSQEMLPVVDMHFHPDADWEMDALLALMDELGVVRAVGGSGGTGGEALAFASERSQRFVPFAGQDRLRELYFAEGAASLQLRSEATLQHLNALEDGLRAGCWSGIGEVFVNTLGSHRANAFRVPADSPLMQRLWQLSAEYGVPLHVHMDAEPASVAEMRRLLASDPEGTWIWAHAGWYASPGLLRELMRAHPNLYADLSFRDESRSFYPVTEGGTLQAGWKLLLEEMPGRFFIGTDVLSPTASEYSQLVRFWRDVLGQLSPEVAAMIAHRNAERFAPQYAPADPETCEALARR